MPWKETCPMDERLQFVSACVAGEETMACLCRQFGISRKTGYKWLRRYESDGAAGLADRYDIRFAEVLTDNGPEMGQKTSGKKNQHPFERMLMELGITHRYIRPYRPQTNGKVERFWRTLEEDLLHETTFDSKSHLQDELLQYIIYYNEHRPHQGIQGKTPLEMNQNCLRIT